MACKVFHRLALLIKMEHTLNMYIFFPFTDTYIVEVRPIKSLNIDSESLFLDDSLKKVSKQCIQHALFRHDLSESQEFVCFYIIHNGVSTK